MNCSNLSIPGMLAVFFVTLTAVHGEEPPPYPPSEKVLEGYTKIVSTADGQPSLFTVWKRDKDGQMLAELPKDFANKKFFIALTIASGEIFAGLQYNDMYVYLKQYDKRIAIILPNVEVRSNGDQESKNSVKRIFTDRVLIDVPIVTMGPGGGPVIDMDDLCVAKAPIFFGGDAAGANPNLASIKTAKAFPQNIEIAFEVPVGGRPTGGQLRSFHYSISVINDNPTYKPRVADQRIGYFTTSFNDLGKFTEPDTWVRYVNRWHLEKADPSLSLSPPKEPIVFYIEHTTPIRYRRWVREGIEYWNKAYQKIGFSQAIEVRYQDARTGEHMDKDPEDVRWNFVRWLNNDVGTAIGPSRVHPMTGQILDADIVLTDGWIRAYWSQFTQVLPSMAMEGFTPETLAWLEQRPNWDPRLRLADPEMRLELLRQRSLQMAQPLGGHPLANLKTEAMGDDMYDGLVNRQRQMNGNCSAATMRAFDVATFRMMLALADDPPKEGEKKEEEKKDEKPKEPMIDGMPEAFIGPLLADLVAHEVGHTLGLRHNFKGSSIYSMSKINSNELKGKAAFSGSVMDYLPVNINMDSGETQGDWAMIEVGPYDLWAIEYGYTTEEKNLKDILARVAEPELRYGTDEDTGSCDPLSRRYDFGADPLNYAKSQYKLAKYHRDRLIDKFVKDGDSWSTARRGYEMTLMLQMRSLSMMSGWVGGAFVHRDKKGDKNGRVPIEVVPVAAQREALQFIIEHSFPESIYGLTPDILARMTVDKWLDAGGINQAMTEPAWPVHDRILGLQSSVLTMLMNPTTLRRVYDNEFRVPADQDALTLPELLDAITNAIWNDLEKKDGEFTARKPMISSMRRNLQHEHLDRLIDLSLPQKFSSTSAESVISNLAMLKIREIKDKVQAVLGMEKLDPYTRSHLSEVNAKIEKLLNSQMIFNAKDISSGGGGMILHFGDQAMQVASWGNHQLSANGCSCTRCLQSPAMTSNEGPAPSVAPPIVTPAAAAP